MLTVKQPDGTKPVAAVEGVLAGQRAEPLRASLRRRKVESVRSNNERGQSCRMMFDERTTATKTFSDVRMSCTNSAEMQVATTGTTGSRRNAKFAESRQRTPRLSLHRQGASPPRRSRAADGESIAEKANRPQQLDRTDRIAIRPHTADFLALLLKLPGCTSGPERELEQRWQRLGN